MKLLPLIGALLLSAAPVQADEAQDEKLIELLDPCYNSDQISDACFLAGTFHSMVTGFSLICNLWDDEDITEAGFIKSVERLKERVQEHEKVAWNIAVRNNLGFHPNCPIRPIP